MSQRCHYLRGSWKAHNRVDHRAQLEPKNVVNEDKRNDEYVTNTGVS